MTCITSPDPVPAQPRVGPFECPLQNPFLSARKERGRGGGREQKGCLSSLCSSRILGGPVPQQLFLQPVLARMQPHAPHCHQSRRGRQCAVSVGQLWLWGWMGPGLCSSGRIPPVPMGHVGSHQAEMAHPLCSQRGWEGASSLRLG